MRTVDALKPLTAGELLELWRYYRERVEDPLERTLLCNAAILRDSCYCQGEAIYGDELEVLRDLTPGEMEDLLLRLAEDELPEGARVRFWDVPGTSWAYAAVTRLAGLGLLPFGSDGWFRPDAGLTWRDFSGVLDKLAQTEAGRAAFPVLAAAWSEKTLAAAEADETAAEAVLTRAELARALNSLLGRCPDGQDAQLQAAAWYRDNQDQTAWYYADLIEASADHTCRLLPQGEQWTAIG